MRAVVTFLCLLGVSTVSLPAAEQEKSGTGSYVSFVDGTLTIKGKSGLLTYKRVGANYKSFENNEDGPGSNVVETVAALSRVLPGTVVQVDVEAREISFGLDHRVIGTFVSFEDGQLNLLAAEAPKGFVAKPSGKITLAIDPNIPVLESINGGDYKFAGPAGKVLKSVKQGEMITARSEYDPAIVEVIQTGAPKRRMERYIGQSRGTVRGTFTSFKNDVLRIRGKAVTSLAANEYERVIAARITDSTPIVESIDGGAYKPADLESLKSLKEGAAITIHKAEDIVLEVRIGVEKQKSNVPMPPNENGSSR